SLGLQPLGVTGQLCIVGAGLARGYLNNPELTAERFVNNKFQITNSKQITKNKIQITNEKQEKTREQKSELNNQNTQYPIPNTQLYLTGDLARWQPNGNIEYLGRIDQQVKIRGYRIEPGEIEARMLEQKVVKEAVVIVKDDAICAYYVPGVIDGQKPGSIPQEIKNQLAQFLPEYMIPTYCIPIRELPLTHAGKVDTKALPQPDHIPGENITPPRNETEKTLTGIWSEVLKVGKENIGIDSDFFQLGGHSLKATIMLQKINEQFKTNLPLAQFFKNSTVRHLADLIRKSPAKQQDKYVKEKNIVLLRKAAAAAKHLFLVHPGSGVVESYVHFCNHLKPFNTAGLNIWGLKADSLENYTPHKITVGEMARNYIKRIEKVQPQGPYRIAGWSIGGTIAFEMARRLEQTNRGVALLALIDTQEPLEHPAENPAEFTLQSELETLRDFAAKLNTLHGTQKKKTINEKIKTITAVNQVWPFIIDYFETGKYDVAEIKKTMHKGITQLVPNFEQAGIREIVYYLNMIRTLKNAIDLYKPPGKIETEVHYFNAEHSQAKYDNWNEYTIAPLRVQNINGDHYSILT
ncbi:MAG: AMP-binding protein, partial [bacterium]|nr:AMP-binding protein [bacterium]